MRAGPHQRRGAAGFAIHRSIPRVTAAAETEADGATRLVAHQRKEDAISANFGGGFFQTLNGVSIGRLTPMEKARATARVESCDALKMSRRSSINLHLRRIDRRPRRAEKMR